MGSKIRTFLEVIGWLPHTLRSMWRVNLVFLISVQQLVEETSVLYERLLKCNNDKDRKQAVNNVQVLMF